MSERIGTKSTNKHGEEAEVISYNNRKDFKIKFLESGYVRGNLQWQDFINGKFIQPSSKSVFDHGSIGEIKNPSKHPFYFMWRAMVKRHRDGLIRVGEDWLCFETWLKQTEKMEGYVNDLSKRLVIPFDFLEYNKENACWIKYDWNKYRITPINQENFYRRRTIRDKEYAIASYLNKTFYLTKWEENPSEEMLNLYKKIFLQKCYDRLKSLKRDLEIPERFFDIYVEKKTDF